MMLQRVGNASTSTAVANQYYLQRHPCQKYSIPEEKKLPRALKLCCRNEVHASIQHFDTFSSSGKFCRKSSIGLEYSASDVTFLVSIMLIPDPARSKAIGSSPDSSSRAIVLYQHQAPNPSPCTKTNFFVLIFSKNSGN